MTELATAYISIVAETSGIPRQVSAALGQAEREAGAQGRRVGQSFSSSFGASLKGMAVGAGVLGGIAAVGAAMKSAISTGMDFTTSLNTMQAVSGASAAQLKAVSAEARQLGTDNTLASTSSVDAANAMLELAKGGFTVQQSMQAARGTLQLAAAAQISAADAATIQSQALQAFGEQASYAGTAADILANTANASSAEITDVAFALQQSGAVAHQFGISMQDTAATIGLMANSGIQGADAGTLLKSALLALTDQSKPARAAMEELGLTVYDQHGRFEGMSNLFGQLQTASKHMTAEQYQAATATLFGSDAMRIAGIAAQQGKTGFDQMAAAMGRQGAAADVAAAKMHGLPGAWEQLKNSAQDAGLAFYDAVQGPLTTAAKAGSDAIENVVSSAHRMGGELASAFDALKQSGYLTTWGKDLASVWGDIEKTARNLAPLVQQFAEVLAKAGGALALVGWNTFLTVLQATSSTVSALSPLLSGLADIIRDNQGAVTALVAAYAGLKIINSVSTNLQSGFTGVRTGVAAADVATGMFARTLQSLGGAGGRATNATTSIRDFGSALKESVTWMRQANPEMSNLRAGFEVVRANGVNATGAMTGLKSAGGLLVGAMGGPLGIALAAGGTALGLYAQHQAEAKAAVEAHKQAVDLLSQSINFNTGELDANGKKQVYNELSNKGVFTDAKKAGVNVSAQQIQQAGEGDPTALKAVNSALDEQVQKSVASSKAWRVYGEGLQKAGVTLGDFTSAIRGSKEEQDRVNTALGSYNLNFKDLAGDLDGSAQAAIRVGNAIGSSTDNIGEAVSKAKQQADALGVVSQNMASLADQFKGQGKGFSIQVDTTQVAGTEALMTQLGFTIKSLPNGKVQVTANTADAAQKLQWVTQNTKILDALRANPQIDLNKAQFDAKEADAHGALAGLDRSVVSPQANLVIDKLLAGKAVSMQELQTLSATTANPKVDADIAAALAKLGIISSEIDRIAQPRNVQIGVTYVGNSGAGGSDRISFGGGASAQADGGIVAMATGGLRQIQKPTDADIFQGRGAGTIFAEEETGGEAYIPLALAKRSRSQKILQAVAQMFGLAVVPGSLSGLAGGMAGGSVSALLKAAGVDGVRSFADGGVVTNAQLRDLANGGAGASRPLTGAPYVRGGINWGDCSAAMSAFARFAAGLAPFGGRTSTATMGDYLAKLGAKTGTGPLGSLRFGWVNGGPGGGHTAGTLPDGTNIEMGGAYNGGMVGGNVGADDSQFTDHAWMPVKDSSKFSTSSGDDAGSESTPGSGSSLPDSTIGSGYSFDPLTTDTSAAGSGDTSLSGRAGTVVGAFVTGQLSSLLGSLKINDQPGWLAAIAEYERQHGENAKKNYDAEKKKADQDFSDAADDRKADYDDAKAAIESDYEARRISADERDRRLLKLKDTYDATELAKRHDYEKSVVALGGRYGQVDNTAGQSLSAKQRFEDSDLQAGQQYENDRFNREAAYDRDVRALQSLRDSNAISQAEFTRRSQKLEAGYNTDTAKLKSDYTTKRATLKSAYDQSQEQYSPSDRYLPNSYRAGTFHPTDPGTNRPAAGQDQPSGGSSRGSTSKDVKTAVQDAMSDRGWNYGSQWKAVDYIVSNESSWNPTATNPQSGAFGLFQFLGSTLDKYLPDRNADPRVQGDAGEAYIGDRYGTPEAAQSFWKKNHWYDDGGIGGGIGVMQKNVLAPERVLSPRQTSAFEQMVRRDFQGGSDLGARLDRLIELTALMQQTLATQLRESRRGAPAAATAGDSGRAARRTHAALAAF